MSRIPLLAASLALLLWHSPAQAVDLLNADEETSVRPRPAADQPLSESDRLAVEALRLIGAGDLEQASARINAALKMRADRSYYHLINGLAYHLQARRGTHASFELAEQGYQLAIQFDASNWLARYFAGQLALDMGKYGQARLHLAEALLFRNDDPELLGAFAYAAYRSGYPDLAAGGIDTLDKLGRLDTEAALRNAAMIMAAAGEDAKARDYQARLQTLAGTRNQVDLLRRLDDWSDFYRQQGRAMATKVSAQAGESVSFGSAVQALSEKPPVAHVEAPSVTLPTVAGSENKMVAVDVVMIATEETMTTAKGLNLLNSLSIQFGSDSAAAYSRVGTRGIIADTLAPNGESTSAITRVLTIPAITYSLNIANSNTQRNEILARPTLVATAGRASEFFYGIELNAAVAPGGNSAAAPISIQKDIGVKLAVTPVFVEGGQISLAVSAQRSFIKTPSPDNTFTLKLETSKSQVSANVVMRFGETLILGGLSEKEADKSRDGVPLLQELPGVQYLFSRATSTDIQKSVLILITPRPVQYVYQTDNARQAHEQTLSEDERPIASLRARYGDWFRPYPNWASIFHHMQENSLYREFRTGDVALESWTDMRTLKDRLKQVGDFLYF